MLTHHFVIKSSLRFKILKIDKLGDFSCDSDYSSRTDVFRDVISLRNNQCDPRRPQGASGGHKMSASRVVQQTKHACYNITRTDISFKTYIKYRGKSIRPPQKPPYK